LKKKNLVTGKLGRNPLNDRKPGIVKAKGGSNHGKKKKTVKVKGGGVKLPVGGTRRGGGFKPNGK